MKTFRALSTIVAVSIDDDVPQADLAHAIVAPYPEATTDAQLHYHVRATEVLRDSAALPLEDPRDVVPLFEMDLYERLVARAPTGWLLHAAAVEVGDQAVVLCGQSGAGKTTLALALAARGHRLLTEEVVWISRAGQVCGLPRPLHVPAADTHKLDSIPADWRRVPYEIRDRTGSEQKNVVVVPPASVFQFGSLPLRAIIRMGHGPDWPVYLRESPAPVALSRLWDRSLRHDEGDLEVATTLLRTFGSYELSSRSQIEALTLLDPLFKSL